MKTYEDKIAEFVKERSEALASLNEQKIRAFFKKWNDGSEMPSNPEVFWRAIHKAITGDKTLPIEFRRKSKAWLLERGSASMDDGDL